MSSIKFAYLAAGMIPVFAGCSGPAPRQNPPNIVFIMSDDHAFQAISAYGHPIGKAAPTPNIDRIASEGMIFQRAYVANSISGPSRACIITGKHSHKNGFRHNGDLFNNTQFTFPAKLKEAGYQTAMVGKWHLGSLPSGFDYSCILPDQGRYYNPDFITGTDTFSIEGYVTDIITDLALKWLDNRNQEKPFLLMYQHKAPHREWLPAEEYLNLFSETIFPEPASLFDDYEKMGEAAGQAEMLISEHMDISMDNKIHPDIAAEKGMEPFLPWYRSNYHLNLDRMNASQRQHWEEVYRPINDEFMANTPAGNDLVRYKYQRYLRDYLACIRSVDDGVGEILDYLKENGLEENTIVIYTSDQGFYLGEHGWFDKRFMYEESFRTPLLIKYPGMVKPGSSSQTLVQNIDFAPTFLELAGIPVPDEIQGLSLLPVLRGENTRDRRNSLYYHYYEYPGIHMAKRHYGIATDRYKLIHFYNDIDEWELYDLEEDPMEMNNLINIPEKDALVTSLKKQLDSLMLYYEVPPIEAWKDEKLH